MRKDGARWLIELEEQILRRIADYERARAAAAFATPEDWPQKAKERSNAEQELIPLLVAHGGAYTWGGCRYGSERVGEERELVRNPTTDRGDRA